MMLHVKDWEVGAFEEVLAAPSTPRARDISYVMPDQTQSPSIGIRIKLHEHFQVPDINVSEHRTKEAVQTDVSEQHVGTNVSPICNSTLESHPHEVCVGPRFPRLRIGGVLIKSQSCSGSRLRVQRKRSMSMSCQQQEENYIHLKVPRHMRATISVSSAFTRTEELSSPNPENTFSSGTSSSMYPSPIVSSAASVIFGTSSCSPALDVSVPNDIASLPEPADLIRKEEDEPEEDGYLADTSNNISLSDEESMLTDHCEGA